jgi:uncharacterized protein with FMN-binding domain
VTKVSYCSAIFKVALIKSLYMKKLLLSTTLMGTFGIYSLVLGKVAPATPAVLSSGTSDTPVPLPGNQQPAIGGGGAYRNGEYIGDTADAFYGNIQVKVTVKGGQITDVQFLQYPNDRGRSIAINTMAMPQLRSEAIRNQTAQVDIISGATDSSQAFIQSLASALTQAK